MVIGGSVVRVSDGTNTPPGMGISFSEVSAHDEAFIGEILGARALYHAAAPSDEHLSEGPYDEPRMSR